MTIEPAATKPPDVKIGTIVHVHDPAWPCCRPGIVVYRYVGDLAGRIDALGFSVHSVQLLRYLTLDWLDSAASTTLSWHDATTCSIEPKPKEA